ncbi:MAG TPA: S-layer homology domain-containing protein, partial [Bacillales bacterium]|nr:S-layer homology domain-containing protein [Bacillales bacterium]
MGFRKLALGMVASLVVLMVCFNGQSKAAGKGFSDFNQKDWGYSEVHYLVGKGVLEGYPDGTFKPDKAIKRKEAATMIGRVFDLNGEKRKTEFPDVDRYDYASGYIQSGADNGYITGYPDHTFRPNQSMQRDEMAYLVSRAFSLKDVNKFLPYTDVIQNKDNYIPINKVTTAGINNGYEDGTFRPDKNISRREFSIMVARAMNSKFRPTQSQSFEFEGV